MPRRNVSSEAVAGGAPRPALELVPPAADPRSAGPRVPQPPRRLDVFGQAGRSAPATRVRWPRLRRLLVLSDLVGVAIGALIATYYAALSPAEALLCSAVLVASWSVGGWLFGAYAGDDLRAWATGVPVVPRLLITALTVVWPFYALMTHFGEPTAGVAALVALAVSLPLAMTLRTAARGHVHRRADLRQRVVIVGSGVIASRLVAKLRSQTQFGLDPIGFVDDDPHMVEGATLPHLGDLAALPSVLREREVDRVIFAFSRASHDDLLRSIRAARDSRVAVDIVPRLFEFLDGVQGLVNVGGLPLLSMTVPRLSPRSQAAKRMLDAAVAAAALSTLMPLLIALAALIKLDSPGPVLFRQRRVGRNGERFEVFKFRSMYCDADERKAEFAALNNLDDGVMFKIHADPRVTAIGRMLRRYSLDEIPQLINVPRGSSRLAGR